MSHILLTMTYQSEIEDKLPKCLKSQLSKLLEDNTISSWRIYGGNNITLSVKFEVLDNDPDQLSQDLGQSVMHGVSQYCSNIGGNPQAV